MPGENESPKSVEASLGELDSILQEYESKTGIKNINPNIDAEKYLAMPTEILHKLTAEECGEASIILAQFGFYLQRSFNIETGRINWASSMIDRVLASEAKQYNAPSAAERRMLAIRNNEGAKKLENIRCNAQARADRLNYMSAKVESLSQRFADLQVTKRGKLYG